MNPITKYTDLMLDLETLGTAPGSVILSVAAVPFFKGDFAISPEPFHKNVDIQSCLDAGLKIEPNTLHWWIQKAELFQLLQQDTFELKGVLERLASFIKANCTERVRVWGKGPSFDNASMRDAYGRFQMELPWRYSCERCVRTDLCGYEERLREHFPFEGVVHHPVQDSIYQINCMAKVRSIALNPEEYELH